MTKYFTPALFRFLRQLKDHNDRGWFRDHRAEFVADVEGPMLAFIADVGPKLAVISRAVVADPRRTGGSMFRIYRDTRFSADKSPYKVSVAASFPHVVKRDKAKELAAVPGFYLHLEPGDSSEAAASTTLTCLAYQDSNGNCAAKQGLGCDQARGYRDCGRSADESARRDVRGRRPAAPGLPPALRAPARPACGRPSAPGAN